MRDKPVVKEDKPVVIKGQTRRNKGRLEFCPPTCIVDTLHNGQINLEFCLMSSIEQNKQAVSVTQDNQLVESTYKLTLNEKRLLLVGISKIDPRAWPTKQAAFDLTAKEWQAQFPEAENPWRDVKTAAKGMMRRHITFHPKVGVAEDVNWLDSVRYHEREGRVTVKFTMTVTTRLQGMMGQFTSLKLMEVTKLNSFHSIRMYEYLSQFRSTGYRRVTLEDLRFAMNCIDLYPSIRDFKRRVLYPAVKELNEKCDFEIECRNVKRGRRITGFEFIIKEQTQGDLFN